MAESSSDSPSVTSQLAEFESILRTELTTNNIAMQGTTAAQINAGHDSVSKPVKIKDQAHSSLKRCWTAQIKPEYVTA